MESWLAEQADQPKDTMPLKLFPFDPNTIGREEWRALGLTDKQIDGVDKYMSKGGRFRTKKDLGRMYSIKADQFAALEPFILLPDSYVRAAFPKREFEQYADRKPKGEEIREPATYERPCSTNGRIEHRRYNRIDRIARDRSRLFARSIVATGTAWAAMSHWTS